jgi:hypothetical protein
MPSDKEKEEHKMPPRELIEKLAMWCRENGLAMALLGGRNIHLILMATDESYPDDAAIVAAHLLLSGVIDGKFREENQSLVHDETSRKPS